MIGTTAVGQHDDLLGTVECQIAELETLIAVQIDTIFIMSNAGKDTVQAEQQLWDWMDEVMALHHQCLAIQRTSASSQQQ